MLDASYRFAGTDTVRIVGVFVAVVGFKLSALLPSQRVTEVACRVALCIVCDTT